MIRHGHYAQPAGVPSAWLPYGLTDQGTQQSHVAARVISELLERHGWRLHPVIDCSRLRRAWETATILAQQLGESGPLEVQQFDALAERSVGALANLDVDSIAAVIADDPRCEPLPKGWKRDSHFCLPVQGAESLMQAGQRVASHIERRLQGVASDQLKLFVGHGGALRHAAHLMGVLRFEQIAQLSMFHASPIVFRLVDGGCVHVTGDWKVRSAKERQID